MRTIDTILITTVLLDVALPAIGLTACGSSDQAQAQPAVSSAGEVETVSVDLSADVGPVTHCGSGFLHAMSDTVPDIRLIEPLRPRMVRQSMRAAVPCYERVRRRLGARLQIVLSDSHGYRSAEGWPGDEDWDPDYAKWLGVVEQSVETIRAKGYEVDWDIWNEPNIELFWGRSREQFFETWRRTAEKIRQIDPDASLVGPSITRFDPKYLEDFLLFAKEHDVLPDILCWHELTPGEVRGIEAKCDQMRRFMKESGITERPISINEIVALNDQYKCGVLVWFFSGLEAGRVASAAHACWPDPPGARSNCWNHTLDGLLTPETRRPRATWWVYKAHAEMSGRRARVSPSRTVEGLASFDREARCAIVLLGRHGDPSTTGPVRLELIHLTDVLRRGNGSVALKVRVDRIPATGQDPLEKPKTVFFGTLDAKDDPLPIPLSEFGPNDAYQVEIRAGTGE